MKKQKNNIKVVKTIGRPSIKTPEMEKEILDRITKGESVTKICKDTHLPNESTVYDWIKNDDEFAKRYARAKEIMMDKLADEILEISDDDKMDTQAFVGVNHIHRARLKVDTRKWLMSKLAPKKYGDKMDLNHSGDMSIHFHEEKTYEVNQETDTGN